MVCVRRVLDGFDGLFAKIDGLARHRPGDQERGHACRLLLSHENTHSFVAVNRLLAAGEDVSWLANGPLGAGTFFVSAKPTTPPILQKAASDLGVSFQTAAAALSGRCRICGHYESASTLRTADRCLSVGRG
jgi:hypothetical protein